MDVFNVLVDYIVAQQGELRRWGFAPLDDVEAFNEAVRVILYLSTWKPGYQDEKGRGV